MKQVIKFNTSADHYRSDGCVFFCFDRRFKPLRDIFLNEYLKLRFEDLVQVAGGAMELRSRGSEAYNAFLGQAVKSWKLHGTKDFYPVIHADCGAYKVAGLLKEGVNEKEFLEQELLDIKDNLLEDLKEAGCLNPNIKMHLADFDGLWEVE